MTVEQGDNALATLLARAEEMASKSDARAAVSFYQAAFEQARVTHTFDPAMASRLQRGQEFIRARMRDFEQALDACLPRKQSADPIFPRSSMPSTNSGRCLISEMVCGYISR